MEKKAGYKECPRCGLRNKPTALQCDFCGLRFTAGEDWEDNIQALEKIGALDDKVTVDEDVSKRIEATIVKRDKIQTGTTESEPAAAEFDYFRHEAEPELKEQEKAVPANIKKEPELAPEPLAAEPQAIHKDNVAKPQAPSEELADRPAETSSVAEPEVHEQQENAVVPQVQEPAADAISAPEAEASSDRSVTQVHEEKAAPKGKGRAVALFAGIALYAAGIALYLLGFIDRSIGWVMVIAASIMVVMGAERFISGIPRTDDPGEPQDVLICPKCHELVTINDETCPDCGARFAQE